MQYLKQSTAITLKIGPFLDDADGKTAETGLTITAAEVRVSKNGANIIPKNEANACTHDEIGVYGCPVDATDTNTLGRLQIWVHESGALPVWHEFMVVTANVYDSLCSTDTLQSDITQIGGVSQSATDLKDFADTGYDPATHYTFGVTTCTTTTTNTDMVGTDNAALAATALTDVTWTDAKAAFLDHSIATVDGVCDTIAVDVAGINGEAMRGTDSAALATGVDVTSIHGSALTETVGGYLAAGFTKLFDVATPVLVASDVMRGTDGANTTVPDAAGVAATPAEVNTEMLDVMKTDVTSEMVQGAPPATPTFEEMIAYIYFSLRNKTETTASENAVYNNAGDTKLFKAVISDNGTTFAKAEYVSG